MEWTLDVCMEGLGSSLRSTYESSGFKYVKGTLDNVLTIKAKAICPNGLRERHFKFKILLFSLQ